MSKDKRMSIELTNGKTISVNTKLGKQLIQAIVEAEDENTYLTLSNKNSLFFRPKSIIAIYENN